MLIPARYLRRIFRVRPRGVLHLGAHLAEEFDQYKQEGFGRVLWVEAQERLIAQLKRRVAGSGDAVFRGAVWSASGSPITLNVADSSQGASLFHFPPDYRSKTEVEQQHVTTVTVEDLIPIGEFFDFVNLDIQGSELEALRGMGARMRDLRWVYCEVNRAQLYEGIPMVGEIDDYLGSLGFFRAVTIWTPGQWGDALYVRRSNWIRDTGLRFVGCVFSLLVRLGFREVTRTVRIRLRKFRRSKLPHV